MRYLTEQDIEALAIGAAILGTGGGGNPYIGKLRCLQELRRGKPVALIGLDELADDALVVPIGGIGAPVVGIEKLEEGNEGLRALRALEGFCGRKVDALISAEIGGGNAMEPIITAAAAGIGVVDGDGMGRAFPEMQMTTFSIYGHRFDPRGPGRRARQRGAVSTCGVGGMVRAAGPVGRGHHGRDGHRCRSADARGVREARRRAGHRDPGDPARQLVLEANREHSNAIPLICAAEQGLHLMDAKIVELKRHLRGGFAVGEIALEGIDTHAGSRAQVVFQNEFLSFERGGMIEVSVPDLIVILDVDTGHAITTEVLRYGQRVAVAARRAIRCCARRKHWRWWGRRRLGSTGWSFGRSRGRIVSFKTRNEKAMKTKNGIATLLALGATLMLASDIACAGEADTNELADIVVTAQKTSEPLSKCASASPRCPARRSPMNTSRTMPTCPGRCRIFHSPASAAPGNRTSRSAASVRRQDRRRPASISMTYRSTCSTFTPPGATDRASSTSIASKVLRGPRRYDLRRQFHGRHDHFVSNQPDLNKVSGSVHASVGGTQGGGANYESDSVVNLPLVDGVAALRIGALYDHESGWIDRANPDGTIAARNINDVNTTVIRATVKVQPTAH